MSFGPCTVYVGKIGQRFRTRDALKAFEEGSVVCATSDQLRHGHDCQCLHPFDHGICGGKI
jgi:hypothetical protein